MRSLVTKNSPLKPEPFQGEGTPQTYYKLSRDTDPVNDSIALNVLEVMRSLDDHNRWLVKHVMISNPYIGDGQNQEATQDYASTRVGDNTDTSPFRDTTDQKYISTTAYIRNMKLLMNYIVSSRKIKPFTKAIKGLVGSCYLV